MGRLTRESIKTVHDILALATHERPMYEDIYFKLKQYESTGLTPEEIIDLDPEAINIARELAIQYLKQGIKYNEECIETAKGLGIDASSVIKANEGLKSTLVRLEIPAAGRGKR